MELYKKLKTRTSILVFLLSLLSFTLLYLRLIYVFETEFTIYGSYFLQYFIDTLTTLFVAVTVLSGRGFESHKSRVFSSLKLSLPRLVYLFPYYYLYYMSVGYDSIESFALLLIRSAFMLILFTLETQIYFAIACFVAKKASNEWDFYAKSRFFDFSVGATAAIFSICFMKFIISLLSEGVDVIIYLIDYEEFYSATEIYYLLGKVSLAFVSLFISHILFMLLRKRFEKMQIQK
ncbi:MAG: hypothetical protein IJW38_03435 [Clostridia bacterium]|nr:hypothetical protein [Clostridia bacterium]